MKNALLTVLVLATLGCMATAQTTVLPNHHEVKYVIFMVPDGMGLSDVTAARIQRNGLAGAPLWLETLEHIGYQRTFSEKNTVTDSSAAASAWACGEKFINNEVCLHLDGRPNNFSLLELAKQRGMATGLVATQTITHATPAAFASHVSYRGCEKEVARQYIQLTQPDLMLGGGRSNFNSTTADACGASGDYITQATAAGYAYVTTAADLATIVGAGPRRVLGLFSSSYLLPEVLRTPTTTQPHLAEMGAAALALLSREQAGFFLLIEGSHVDSCNHLENFPCTYGEIAAFDDTVKVVLDWINASSERRQHTLLIIAADHETGGFAVKGTEIPMGEPFGYFEAGWLFAVPPEPEAHHTGGDTIIWSQGPGSESLNRAMDNTWVYSVVKNVLK